MSVTDGAMWDAYWFENLLMASLFERYDATPVSGCSISSVGVDGVSDFAHS
ncbi:MAG TPA: hypothetical protein VNO70_14725 [Blastocatellia bacterium]|nr:hypothetical protein [Blastocatellia bacterium]